MRLVVYISGPFTGKDGTEEVINAVQASVWAYNVAEAIQGEDGFYPFVPHTNAFFSTKLSEKLGLTYLDHISFDLMVLSHCDAIFLIPGWEKSRGAKIERNFALKNGIPVFTSLWAMVKWRYNLLNISDQQLYLWAERQK